MPFNRNKANKEQGASTIERRTFLIKISQKVRKPFSKL